MRKKVPDLLLDIGHGSYFYMRDDRKIGLSIRMADGGNHYVSFDLEQLVEVVKAVGLRYINRDTPA